MAQGDYIFQGLNSAGDSIAAAIERKKQRDAFAQFQQTPAIVTQNPTTPSGDYAFGVSPTQAPNPAYGPALLHYLSQSGAPPNLLAQMSMELQKQNLGTNVPLGAGESLVNVLPNGQVRTLAQNQNQRGVLNDAELARDAVDPTSPTATRSALALQLLQGNRSALINDKANAATPNAKQVSWTDENNKPQTGIPVWNKVTKKYEIQPLGGAIPKTNSVGLNSSQRAGLKYFDNVATEENAVSLMKDATDKPSGPGDVVLAINHLKTAFMGGKNFRVNQAMIDQAEKSRSVTSDLIALLQKAGLTGIAHSLDPYANVPADQYPPGGVLTPAQRQQMLSISVKAMNNLRKTSRNSAKPFGVTPDLEPPPLDNIKDLYEPGMFGGEQASGPKVGDVEDGHKFKGGDPSKPENWEVVP